MPCTAEPRITITVPCQNDPIAATLEVLGANGQPQVAVTIGRASNCGMYPPFGNEMRSASPLPSVA